VNTSKLKLTDAPGFNRLWNRLVEEMQRCVITSVRYPLMMSSDGNGQRLEMASQFTVLPSVAPKTPFQIYVGGGSGESAWRTFKVHAGAFNNFLPRKTGSLSGSLSTDDDTTAGNTIIVCPASGTYCVYAVQSRDSSDAIEFTTCAIITAVDTNHGWPGFPVTDQVRNSHFELIGFITTGTDENKSLTITQLRSTNIEFILPENTTPWRFVARSSTPLSPGSADWRTVNLLSPDAWSVGGYVPSNASSFTVVVAASGSTLVYVDQPLDTSTGAPNGAGTLNNASSLPTQPTPAANEFPSHWYIPVALLVASPDTAKQFFQTPLAGAAVNISPYATGFGVSSADGVYETVGMFIW
jgi:hypothetical protein